MLQLNKDSTYIFSDTHFYHKNIIKYCNRPWELSDNGVEQMNIDIFNNIVSTIPNNSVAIDLGDSGMMYNIKVQKLEENLIKSLKDKNCYIIHILGNHDKVLSSKDNGPLTAYEWFNGLRFSKDKGIYFSGIKCDIVTEGPIIVNDNIILSHEPVQNVAEPYLNIHGHTHDKSAFSDDPTFDKCLLKNYFNASLDVIEFKPILLNELLATKYL
jgi:calcineurin-like phosphoesterase family protein